jgi:predicted ATP-binding protein involved in virulence
MELATQAVNHLLPKGTEFARVTNEGRICFRSAGHEVPTSSLSDGYRSILALAGDLVWRLLAAFPESEDPLREEGVVLIDELDIHLHPAWQRTIAGWLRKRFPNLQFIVATHSPFIAVGAGSDALVLKLTTAEGRSAVETVGNLSALDVDRILRSPAFGLVSTYSPETQSKLDEYDRLRRKRRRTRDEEEKLGQLSLFVAEAHPYGGPPEEGSLEARVDEFLEKAIP